LNQIIHVPVTIGADVPAYNLQSARMELRFTPEILANIFLGKISKWNDPAIVAANPGTSLPDKRITVVHRSDGSGTTYVWADYLSKVSSEWKEKVGKGTSVKWPVGIEGKGNEGVAAAIQQTDGSIGYLELSYAAGTRSRMAAYKTQLVNSSRRRWTVFRLARRMKNPFRQI